MSKNKLNDAIGLLKQDPISLENKTIFIEACHNMIIRQTGWNLDMYNDTVLVLLKAIKNIIKKDNTFLYSYINRIIFNCRMRHFDLRDVVKNPSASVNRRKNYKQKIKEGNFSEAYKIEKNNPYVDFSDEYMLNEIHYHVDKKYEIIELNNKIYDIINSDIKYNIIKLYYFDDMTMQQIGEKYGVTKQTISNRIKQYNKEIKSKLFKFYMF